MSASIVLNAILDTLQKDTSLDAEFSSALTGTCDSTGVTVNGTSTLFLTEVEVGDYIGNPTVGYRRVESITTDILLTVASAFDITLNDVAMKNTRICKGMKGVENLTEVGCLVRLAYISSNDIDLNLAQQLGLSSSGTRVYATYKFVVTVAFYEIDPVDAEDRKMSYDKMLRDSIDSDPTFGRVCVGITKMGPFTIAEHPESNGIYFGVVPIDCFKGETRGDR